MSAGAKFLWDYVKKNANNPVEDWIDRFHSNFSVILLCSFFTLAASGLAAGNAMECMVPKHFTGDWTNFAKAYCYAHPLLTPMEPGKGINYPSRISYFPWIPYFFFFHAIAFSLPKLYWRFLACRFAFDFEPMLKDLNKVNELGTNGRKALIKREAGYLCKHLDFVKRTSFVKMPLTTIFYVSKKWAYVLVNFLQLYCVANVIGGGDFFWAFHVIQHSFTSTTYHPSGFFPLFSWCSLPIAVDNNIDHVSLNCVLGMNVLFEKLYVVVYLWLIMLLGLSLFNALWFTILLSAHQIRALFFHSMLGTMVPKTEHDRVKWFAKEFLRADGSLLILCTQNSYGQFITKELLKELYSLAADRRGYRVGGAAAHKSLPCEANAASNVDAPERSSDSASEKEVEGDRTDGEESA